MKLLAVPLVVLVASLCVGFGLVSAQAGAIAVCVALVATGVAWRIAKLILGGVLILISLG
jgi:hypothetical protein